MIKYLPIEDIGDIIRKRVHATPTHQCNFTLKATGEVVGVRLFNRKRLGYQLVHAGRVVLRNVHVDEVARWMINYSKEADNDRQED